MELNISGNKKKGTVMRVVSLALPKKRLAVLSFLLSLINVLAALAAPLLIGFALDYVVSVGNVDFQSLWRMCAWLLGVYLVSSVSSYYVAYINNALTQFAVKNLRDQLLKKLHRLPVSEIDARMRGDFISRLIGDVDAVGEGILQGFTQAFTGVLSILGIMAFMFVLNAYIALAVIVLSPLSMLTAMFISRRIQKFFKGQSADYGRLSGHAEEMISGQRTVLAFNAQQQSYHTFNEINSQYCEQNLKASFYSSIINPSTRFINNIVYVVCGAMGLMLGLGIGTISSFLMYSNQFARPFNELSSVFSQLQSALASAGRIMEFLDLTQLSPETETRIEDCRGDVKFDEVSFSYVPAVSLIKGFNLEVKAGQKVAIVGPTGSGKTTLANLLMRFYDVDSGKITIDGKDIRDVSRDALRRCFGMVLQDSWLLSGTIRDNIAYYRPDVSDDEVITAAKRAHCHQFITEKRQGYDTMVGQHSSELSEGQKQLINIARVMLKDAPMLILDEATSNIDTLTELYVQQAFDDMMTGKTSFVIAHRLSTIVKSDIILMLENGNITQQGTHLELLQKGGAYAALYSSQFADIL